MIKERNQLRCSKCGYSVLTKAKMRNCIRCNTTMNFEKKEGLKSMAKYFLMIFSLFLMTSVSGNIDISPNPLDIKLKINEINNFSLTITNNLDFTVKSFEFSNLTGFTFPDISIEPNETKEIPFTAFSDELISEQIKSEVSFKYLVNIPEEPTTHNIEITETGFSPSYLNIYTGDSVKWNNTDDITHSVTGSFFDHELNPGESQTITFTNVDEEHYQDLILFWAGTINVLTRDETQEVNNPLLDRTLTINLDVFSDPTNLSINVVDKEFIAEASGNSGSVEGLISIKNIGEQVAQKIELSSTNGWINFDENDFNLNQEKTNFVTFNVNPIILSSNETNKTYNLSITVKGLNTEEYMENISVFVPYSDIFEDFDTSEGFLMWFTEVYCPAHPNLFLCNTSSGQNENNVIIRDPEIPVNLTASQVYAMLKRIQRIEDSNQRTNNKLTTVSKQLEEEFPAFLTLLNKSVSQSEDLENSRSTNEAVFYIALIFTILIAGFLISWNYYEKWRHKEYIAGGYSKK